MPCGETWLGARLHRSRSHSCDDFTVAWYASVLFFGLWQQAASKRSALAQWGYCVTTTADDPFASRRTTSIVTSADPGISPTVSFQSLKVTLCFTPSSIGVPWFDVTSGASVVEYIQLDLSVPCAAPAPTILAYTAPTATVTCALPTTTPVQTPPKTN